jgi:hypothetical protein
VEELMRSPVLRAQIQERKIAAALHPRAELEEMIAEERDAVLRRHGARRRLSAIVVGDAPGGSGGDPEERLTNIRDRIEREMPFAEAARTYSEDPRGRIAGGDLGWHNREGSALPPAVIDAAFTLEVGTLSQPIETPEGWYLLRVDGAEPEPADELLLLRLRQDLQQRLRERMLAEANIRFAEDFATPDAPR